MNGDKNLDISNQDILDIQEETEKLQQEESIFCTVKPEEVPPVPENKFLMRDAIAAAKNVTDLKQPSKLTNDAVQDNREKRNRDTDRK